MRSFPLRICKILCRQRTAKLMYSTTETNVEVAKIISKKFPSEISKAVSVIKQYPLPIPWEQVTKTLAENKEDVTKEIIKSCVQLRDADILMSFYKYMIDKGENFQQINLLMIVKALSLCTPNKILEYEHLLVHLFNECKETMFSSEIFQTYGAHVFSYFHPCYKEFLMLPKNFVFFKPEILICRAFDFDDASAAWKLMEMLNGKLSEVVLQSFISYCIRQALQKEFSVNLIQTLIDICQRKGLIIISSDIICALQPLVNVLRHCEDGYMWSVKSCTVNDQMECLNCNTTLKEVEISEDDFKTLKNAVMGILIPKHDVFLKTSLSELSAFKNFLKNCRPYDMVVDGLNLIYRGVHTNKKNNIPHILANYIKQKKRKVLIIVRKHFLRNKFLRILNDVQIFYTENSSDDDVFLLYAAMHGGLGTIILTSDFLCCHSAKLDDKTRTIFIKWQFSHQCIMDNSWGIRRPSLHLGLSQCTDSPEAGGNSYKWHLSYQAKRTSPYSFRLQWDWICLQAVPKK